MPTTAKVTGPMIRDLQNASAHAALIEVAGRLEVVHHLPTADLADDAIVLRSRGRQWANELVGLVRETAESDGTSTALGTLRAAAGRLATDELTEERARELVVHRPQSRPVPLTRRAGRHAAPQSPDQQHAEWSALMDLLEQLEHAA